MIQNRRQVKKRIHFQVGFLLLLSIFLLVGWQPMVFGLRNDFDDLMQSDFGKPQELNMDDSFGQQQLPDSNPQVNELQQNELQQNELQQEEFEIESSSALESRPLEIQAGKFQAPKQYKKSKYLQELEDIMREKAEGKEAVATFVLKIPSIVMRCIEGLLIMLIAVLFYYRATGKKTGPGGDQERSMMGKTWEHYKKWKNISDY